MNVHFSVLSIDATEPAAITQALTNITDSVSLIVACGNHQDIRTLANSDIGQLPLVGFSSCLTSSSHCDVGRSDERHLQLFVIADEAGAYGIASTTLDTNNLPKQMRQLMQDATAQASRSGQQPQLIWCLQPPGHEEQVLSAIAAVAGPNIPVIGGSSADDDITGQWCQFDGQQLDSNLIVLLVLYPSCPFSSFFSSGYHQLNLHAQVTKAGTRRIYELDQQPAAIVYNSWLQKLTLPPLPTGKILAQSALQPLGRVIAQTPVPLYLLSHPAEAYPDGSIGMMSDVGQGEQLFLMMSSEDALVRRAGHVVGVAADSLINRYQAKPAVALIFYCAGCMLQIRHRYQEVHQHVRAQLGDIPFLIAYTFGEQGCFADGSNRHGNLMISTVLFGTTDDD